MNKNDNLIMLTRHLQEELLLIHEPPVALSPYDEALYKVIDDIIRLIRDIIS